MIKLGSAFSGIGGFELGLHWAIEDLETVWQIEKDKYCQTILKKHWPKSRLYDDITTVKTKEMESVDVLCGGFPCQDLSVANPKGEGLNGKRSGLFWELWRIVSDFREQNRQIPIVLLENVPAITYRGLGTVLGALSQIGYNAEWFTIRASDFGAPHRRERWFCICYASNPIQKLSKEQSMYTKSVEKKRLFKCRDSQNAGKKRPNHWKKDPIESPICSVDDGVPNRLAKLNALGNAIVPQCSKYIGQRLVSSGLLEDMLCN